MSRSAARLLALTLASAVAVLAAARPASAAPNDPDCTEYRLILRGALFQGDAPGESDRSLMLWIPRSQGRWQRVWGVARNYNVAYHEGRVAASEAEGDALTLSLEMQIGSRAPSPARSGGMRSAAGRRRSACPPSRAGRAATSPSPGGSIRACCFARATYPRCGRR